VLREETKTRGPGLLLYAGGVLTQKRIGSLSGGRAFGSSSTSAGPRLRAPTPPVVEWAMKTDGTNVFLVDDEASGDGGQGNRILKSLPPHLPETSVAIWDGGHLGWWPSGMALRPVPGAGSKAIRIATTECF
jgi:hypothetical protein